MTAVRFYDDMRLNGLHLLLHQPPLKVCAAVLVLLPLVVIQGNVLQRWPERGKSDNYHDFIFSLLYEQRAVGWFELLLSSCQRPDQLSPKYWNDNDRSWKSDKCNVSTLSLSWWPERCSRETMGEGVNKSFFWKISKFDDQTFCLHMVPHFQNDWRWKSNNCFVSTLSLSQWPELVFQQ